MIRIRHTPFLMLFMLYRKSLSFGLAVHRGHIALTSLRIHQGADPSKHYRINYFYPRLPLFGVTGIKAYKRHLFAALLIQSGAHFNDWEFIHRFPRTLIPIFATNGVSREGICSCIRSGRPGRLRYLNVLMTFSVPLIQGMTLPRGHSATGLWYSFRKGHPHNNKLKEWLYTYSGDPVANSH